MSESKGSRAAWIGRVERSEDGRWEVVGLGPDRERRVLRGGGSVALGDVVRVVKGESDAELVCVEARSGSVKAACMELAAREGARLVFPQAVEDETQAWLEAPGIDDPALEDWTGMEFVTIDNEDSLDLDQAVYVEEIEGGGYVVYYALADAAYYVRAGSALMREAQRRGASYYMPSWMVPMLPRSLSEGLVSLNEGVDRRALCFKMVVREAGVETTLQRVRMRSRRKLSYDGVQAFYDDPSQSALSGEAFARSLECLREVGIWLQREAEARNVVEFDRREMVVCVAQGDRERLEAWIDPRNDAQRWNAQISLLCNMEGARFLSESHEEHDHVQPIYRVHPAPGDRQLRSLERKIAEVVEERGLDPKTWAWSSSSDGETLARYLERLSELELDDDGRRVVQAISRQIMLSNASSSYAPERGLHHGLGADEYSRFSSPMREVVGIFTHKEAFEKLGRPEDAQSNREDEELREKVIQAGNRSRQVQRKITRKVVEMVLDQTFEDSVEVPEEDRRVFQGTVVGVSSSRLYVVLDALPLEVKVYAAHMRAVGDVEVEVNETRTAMTCAFGEERCVWRVGDGVALRVRGFDTKSGRWSLLPVMLGDWSRTRSA